MTNPMAKGVIAKMNAAIITNDQPIPINCAMYYAETSPYEVVFMSETRDEDGNPVEWHYARDLLVQGLNRTQETMYGEGDVKVFRENQFLYTVFSQEENQAVIVFMESDMATFLAETAKVVPFGAEKMKESDIDQAIRDLLGG